MPKSTPDFDADELELSALLGQPQHLCPPVDLLLAHQEGVLSADLAQTIEKHLEQCPLCPGLLADLATLPEAPFTAGSRERIASSLASLDSGAARKIPSNALKPNGTHLNLWMFGAIAAGLLVCAMTGTKLYLDHRAATSIARDTLPPTRPRVPTTSVAALKIPLAPLAAPGADAATPLTRGPHRSAEPSIDELLPAFTAYNAGNYATAAKQFMLLKKTYPHSEIVLLYLGVSQLFLHEDSEASTTLALARRGAAPHWPDAEDWYSAIAAQRLHSPEAKTLLDSLCRNSTSSYSAESCRIASTLQ